MTKAVRKAIVRIARDALTTGYRPEHSVQLQRLFQDTSATLEITLAGYLADLAYFGLPDGAFGKRIESAVAKEETEFGRMFAELQRSPLSRAQVNPVLTERLKDLLGSATDLLTPKSITILTTALDQYQRVGRRPDYDYAGISMKLCKVVERELRGRVFVSLRSEFDGDAGRPRLDSLRIASRGVNDRNGDKLLKWLSSEDATRVTRTCCFRVEYDASESSDGLD
jgi:hypothetical protein